MHIKMPTYASISSALLLAHYKCKPVFLCKKAAEISFFCHITVSCMYKDAETVTFDVI
jgi:hypothetical protein